MVGDYHVVDGLIDRSGLGDDLDMFHIGCDGDDGGGGDGGDNGDVLGLDRFLVEHGVGHEIQPKGIPGGVGVSFGKIGGDSQAVKQAVRTFTGLDLGAIWLKRAGPMFTGQFTGVKSNLPKKKSIDLPKVLCASIYPV